MGTGSMRKTARDVMHRGVQCVGEHDSLRRAAQMMRDLNVGALPICGEDDRLKGIITDRDIVVKCCAEGVDLDRTTVGQCAQGSLIWVDAQCSVEEALQKMEQHQIKRLPVIEKPGDLAAMLTNLQEREVLFIDEIHRMAPAIEEILYPAMEDYELDIVIGQGPGARSVKVPVQRFTLIGATTRTGLLTSPLRARFGIVHRLDFYEHAELTTIVTRSARILGVTIMPEAAEEIARRSRGTPRIANRLLRRVRDFAEVRADGRVTAEVCHQALELLEVDAHGFDEADRRLLRTIIDKFGGGPVGLSTLAVEVGEERETVEEVAEPFLVRLGLLARTPRGRIATRAAWQHLGLTPPRSAESTLFDDAPAEDERAGPGSPAGS